MLTCMVILHCYDRWVKRTVRGSNRVHVEHAAVLSLQLSYSQRQVHRDMAQQCKDLERSWREVHVPKYQ